MTTTVDLATRLQSTPDEQLQTLFTARTIPLTGSATFFDIAEQLLSEGSIAKALESCSRHELQLLAAGSSAPRLDDLALSVDGVAYEAVRIEASRGLADWPQEPATTADAPADDAGCAERAFSATVRIAGLVASLHARPADLLSRGGISAADTRRLADDLAAEPDEVPLLAALAERAGLVVRRERTLLAARDADAWLEQPTASRWQAVADAWVHGLPDPFAALLSGPPLSAAGLAAAFPRGTASTIAGATAALQAAAVLGLRDASGPSSFLEGGAALLAPRIPSDIRKVYVQPDLSIVAPGPLAPELDARLRRIADVEQRGVASTYRLSRTSISRALTLGETGDTVRELLESISITALPQPVRYLLDDAASRFAAIRVHAITPDAGSPDSGHRTALRSDDPALLSQLLVDRSLGILGLTQSGTHRLLARPSAETVLLALADQRYPAALEDAAGGIVPLARHVADADETPGRYGELVERLRGSGFDDGEQEQAWLERQLAAAVRDKAAIVVAVEMSGKQREFTLVPLGLSNGRLRAKDAASDVERTLPVSAIVRIGGGGTGAEQA